MPMKMFIISIAIEFLDTEDNDEGLDMPTAICHGVQSNDHKS